MCLGIVVGAFGCVPMLWFGVVGGLFSILLVVFLFGCVLGEARALRHVEIGSLFLGVGFCAC